jgi:hypothetical protein
VPVLPPQTPSRALRGAAFGLLLEIDPAIEIPGIAEVDIETESQTSRPPTRVRLDGSELRRRWSAVEESAELVRELRERERTLLSVQLAPDAGYLLHAPGFARILVSCEGTEMLCDPEPASADWCALLSAQALPLAATLAGLELLHASAVVPAQGALAGTAVLFAGPQGAGKSSLAAALVRRGAALLSDDAVALEPRGQTLLAHPGTTLMQLRPAEHARLSPSQRALLGPAGAALGKQRYAPFANAAPVPLGALFLLQRCQHGAPVQQIAEVNPFELLASTFNLSVRTPARLTRHLDLAVALAAGGRVHRLRIQPGIGATRLAEILDERVLGL